ncbi:MAG: EAL domain-containing protein [Pseudomonadota bacterium]
MTTKRFPRLLFLGLLLGIGVTVVMLAMFYAQYRFLAEDIIDTSTTEHSVLVRESFERRLRSQLHDMSDTLGAIEPTLDIDAVRAALRRFSAERESLTGIRFTGNNGLALTSGELPPTRPTDTTLWSEQYLVMSYPVRQGDLLLGTLTGSFDLTELYGETSAFANALDARQQETRERSFYSIALGTFLTLLMVGLVVWLVARRQTARVRALKDQADKLRNADFGEPLPESGSDELSDLAAVFNDMRYRLQETTISRDYVDSILSGMNEAIIVTGDDGNIKRINRATTILLGYDEDELVNMSMEYIIDNEKTAKLADGGDPGVPKEAFFQSKFGESIPVSYTCSEIPGASGTEFDRIYAAQNITERRRAEKRIRYLARIDALTKIPNRMQFQHLLQRSIARARRASQPLCLFYVDVDHFKEINDTFGHLAGDATLETVAERLTAALPEKSVVGRLAGDEFAVIVKDLGADADIQETTSKLAREILDRLADPFFVQGHEVFMTASMGIAYFPNDAPNVIDLIRNADAALYAAKKAGGNVFAYYEPKMNEAAVERLMTKSKLKRAFERDELLVHYQPKYNLATGEVFGAEALVRWELPDRGLILPSDFIPIAEETNLIIEIGEWVLDKVCEDFRVWQRSVSSAGRVSVNLSLKQLRQKNFIARISSILRGHEVSPTSLELEITETTLMENPDRTIKLLDQLYGLGLHLAIDDFGTGYSSLSALQQFPISTLKIDKSFVRHMAKNPDDATLVATVVQLGRNLNMDVVAEGVEDEHQLALLQRLECNYVQGLLFGDPMSSDNYLELLLAQEDGTDTHRALFA